MKYYHLLINNIKRLYTQGANKFFMKKKTVSITNTISTKSNINRQVILDLLLQEKSVEALKAIKEDLISNYEKEEKIYEKQPHMKKYSGSIQTLKNLADNITRVENEITQVQLDIESTVEQIIKDLNLIPYKKKK